MGLLIFAIPTAISAAGVPQHGTVLAVQASAHRAVIRTQNITSTYALTSADATRLHEGDAITFSLDMTKRPPELMHFTRTGTVATLTPGLPAIRNVPILHEGDRVPDTAFVDQNGNSFRISDFRGRDVVLAFVYTRCKDARECPLISANLAQLQERIDPRAVHLVEITFDPQYDRGAVLRAYAKLFGANSARWSIGTGDPNAVLDFAARFGIQPFMGTGGDLIHTERTALIDRTGTIAYQLTEAGWQPAEILAQIDHIEHRAGNPLAQLDLALSRAAVAVCGNSVAGFSGLADLLVVLLIAGSFGWLFFRVGRAIRRGI